MFGQVCQFSVLATTLDRVDSAKGIIFGVSVITSGDAKGHRDDNGKQMLIDRKTLEQFFSVAKSHRDGIKVKFGKDHAAGVVDIVGTLRNFRLESDRVRADLCLLKSDTNFAKLMELSETAPTEFGLSASFSGDHELLGNETHVRCREIYSVDIVSDPAANPNGLFSTPNPQEHSMKEIALSLGLPETATLDEIKAKSTELAAKCKEMAADEEKKKMAAKKKADDEAMAKGDDGQKYAALETKLTELSAKVAEGEKTQLATKAAAESATKLGEIRALVADASREGKVIPLSETELSALSLDSIKGMIAKLPKGQVKLSRDVAALKSADGKPMEKGSAEFVEFCRTRQNEGALALQDRFFNRTN